MLFRTLSVLVSLCTMVLALTAAYAPDAKEKDQTPAKILKIAADLWCPINCTPLSAEEGIGIDLARKIFEPLGYTVDYMLVPWARALEEVRAGKIDAVIGANQTDDASLIFPQSGVVDITDDFYVVTGEDWKYVDASSLEGRHLGIITDYGYNEIITAFVEKHARDSTIIQKVGGGDALEQNIRKLIAGRINVVVESAPVMQYMLKRLGLQDKVKWAGGIPQKAVYLSFSPALQGSPEHVKHWEEGMARLRASGELQSMYERYGLKPMK